MNEAQSHPRGGIGAILLAGGKSRRMGTDKARLRLNGETFLERLVRLFRSADWPVVIAGGPSDIAPAYETNILHVDDQRIDAGPLEGMRLGLERLSSITEFAFVVSCDSPLLKRALVDHFRLQIGNAQAVVPFSDAEVFGTTALYRTDIHPILDQELALGNHSVKGMLRKLDVHYLASQNLRRVDPELVSLINVNTPADYERVLGLI